MNKYKIYKEGDTFLVICPYNKFPIKEFTSLKQAEDFVSGIMRYCS